MALKVAIAAVAVLMLAGCLPGGAPKAPKACGDFAYEAKCVAKDHCMWDGSACKAK